MYNSSRIFQFADSQPEPYCLILSFHITMYVRVYVIPFFTLFYMTLSVAEINQYSNNNDRWIMKRQNVEEKVSN
jgi:hypothetical protein